MQLEIYEMIGQAISNSRRAGGEVRLLWCPACLSCSHELCRMVLTEVCPPLCFTALSELSVAGGVVPVEQPVFDPQFESHRPG